MFTQYMNLVCEYTTRCGKREKQVVCEMLMLKKFGKFRWKKVKLTALWTNMDNLLGIRH